MDTEDGSDNRCLVDLFQLFKDYKCTLPRTLLCYFNPYFLKFLTFCLVIYFRLIFGLSLLKIIFDCISLTDVRDFIPCTLKFDFIELYLMHQSTILIHKTYYSKFIYFFLLLLFSYFFFTLSLSVMIMHLFYYVYNWMDKWMNESMNEWGSMIGYIERESVRSVSCMITLFATLLNWSDRLIDHTKLDGGT